MTTLIVAPSHRCEEFVDLLDIERLSAT